MYSQWTRKKFCWKILLTLILGWRYYLKNRRIQNKKVDFEKGVEVSATYYSIGVGWEGGKEVEEYFMQSLSVFYCFLVRKKVSFENLSWPPALLCFIYMVIGLFWSSQLWFRIKELIRTKAAVDVSLGEGWVLEVRSCSTWRTNNSLRVELPWGKFRFGESKTFFSFGTDFPNRFPRLV